MLFKGQLPLAQRLMWGIPPLALLGFIGVIFVGFVNTAGRVLVLSPPPGVELLPSVRPILAAALAAAFVCIVPLLMSFWRAVVTPAGRVPAWYQSAHEAVADAFRRANERHARAAAPRTRAAAARPAAAGRGIHMESGSRVLPAYFRGRTAGAVEFSAAESDDEAPEGEAGAAASARSGTSDVPPEPSSATAPPLPLRFAVETPLPPPSRALAAIAAGRYVPGPHDPRWCRPCAALKAPRTHHCSLCGVCTLKMDHHCPWVGNCVGWGNYKAFVLLLAWGFAGTTLVGAVWAPLMAGWWRPYVAAAVATGGASEGTRALATAAAAAAGGVGAPVRVAVAAAAAANAALTFSRAGTPAVLGFVLDVAFAFALLAFVGMHAFLIATGRTTLESALRGDDGPNAYDFGAARNAALVFGRAPAWWAWPALTPDVRAATLGGVYFARSLDGGGRPPAALERFFLASEAAVCAAAQALPAVGRDGATAVASDDQGDGGAEEEAGLLGVGRGGGDAPPGAPRLRGRSPARGGGGEGLRRIDEEEQDAGSAAAQGDAEADALAEEARERQAALRVVS